MSLQDRSSFAGKEIIARQLTTQNLPLAAGKRVVVIGSAKTALDVAGAAAEVAESVTLLARKVCGLGKFFIASALFASQQTFYKQDSS